MLNGDCKDAKEKNATQTEKHGENGNMMADEETQRIKEKGWKEYKEINLIGLNSDQKVRNGLFDGFRIYGGRFFGL